ncbi:MAG: DNA gyrase inhibitor YacG [Planctomycetaceae bacterium]|nr:DNA gyrase inhibitor YacG [Planctomycetaceae bacterium]
MKAEVQLGIKLRCPICDRAFDDNLTGVVLPFCSTRCKQIDAKRWLNEEYGLPYESEKIQADSENDAVSF